MYHHRLLPLLLTLALSFGALAQRPQHPGGSRAFIPVVVHGGGIDSQFRSDVFLFNRGTTDADISLIFTPSAADGRSQFVAVQRFLQPNQMIELEDIVATLFERTGSGSLEISSNSMSLVARSTTYNVKPRGKVGQSVVVATENDATGLDDDPLFLMPVEQTGWWRTNIGFSETAGQSGVVKVTIYSAFTRIESFDIPILPYSHVQIPVKTTDGFSGVRSAAVEVISGGARVVPYASLVENLSGDPMYITGRPAAPSAEQVIPVAAHFNGSDWATQLWYTNVLWATIFDDLPPFEFPPIPALPPVLTFYPSHDPAASRNFDKLGIATYSNNAVFTLFEFYDGAFGHIAVPPSDGSLITTRLSAPAGGSRFTFGTVGQVIDPVPVSHTIGAGESVDAIGITMTDARRTNVGISEITGAPVRVRVALAFPNGTEVGVREVDVAGRAVLQFPITTIAEGWIPFGRVRFSVIGGSGRILAYASVVENASGDPTFILAE
jgi:hypothetical protein